SNRIIAAARHILRMMPGAASFAVCFTCTRLRKRFQAAFTSTSLDSASSRLLSQILRSSSKWLRLASLAFSQLRTSCCSCSLASFSRYFASEASSIWYSFWFRWQFLMVNDKKQETYKLNQFGAHDSQGFAHLIFHRL